MFTQYNKEMQRWEVYKLVQKGEKIKAYRLASEKTKEAAIRKMHELYDREN